MTDLHDRTVDNAFNPLLPSAEASEVERHPILICEDDVADRKRLVAIIENLGIPICEADSIATAYELFPLRNWTLVMIHSSRNPHEALQLCQRIRTTSTTPTLMLTQRSEDVDESMVMANGADDYILKPLDPKIVLARVSQQISRTMPANDDASQDILTKGALALHVSSQQFIVNGNEISLTKTEFTVMEELLRNAGKVTSRNQLSRVLQVTGVHASDHSLDTHLSRLRKKIKDSGFPDPITTVHGVGFRLESR
jgi:DNA-binding response OmpR family regulator